MATIRQYPFVSRLRADSTMYVEHLAGGRRRHRGQAVSFWFRPATAALAEVPLDDREQTLTVSARTHDFQLVQVQANVTYRVVDTALALTRINFGIDPRTGRWQEDPLDLVGGLLVQLASAPVLAAVAGLGLREVLTCDIADLRARVLASVGADERLTERGLAVTDIRIAAIRAEAELERALQARTREGVQEEADRATYARRAHAVERERAIAENELQNRIELAAREHELVTRQGRNRREEAGEEAAAARITADSEAERALIRARAAAEEIALVGTAEAQAERERASAYDGLTRDVLLTLTAQRLTGTLPRIENLTITPDLLTRAVQALTSTDR